VVFLNLSRVLAGETDAHLPGPCFRQHLLDVHILRNDVVELVDDSEKRIVVNMTFFGVRSGLDGHPHPPHDCCRNHPFYFFVLNRVPHHENFPFLNGVVDANGTTTVCHNLLTDRILSPILEPPNDGVDLVFVHLGDSLRVVLYICENTCLAFLEFETFAGNRLSEVPSLVLATEDVVHIVEGIWILTANHRSRDVLGNTGHLRAPVALRTQNCLKVTDNRCNLPVVPWMILRHGRFQKVDRRDFALMPETPRFDPDYVVQSVIRDLLHVS